MKNRPILLIEDNADDERLTLRAFKKSSIGNPISVVRDGQEALDFLFCTGTHVGRDAKKVPQVILLDLNLPKVDGLEVLRRIRAHEQTKRLPVVIMTSSKAEEDLLRSYDLGANSFLRKPVEFNSFVVAVQQLQLYWMVLNESAPT